jgi:hypothetical protein
MVHSKGSYKQATHYTTLAQTTGVSMYTKTEPQMQTTPLAGVRMSLMPSMTSTTKHVR